MAEKQSVYAKGLYFNPNHPDTKPEIKAWKKGSVSVHIDNFIEQLKTLKSEADQKGYVRFDLTLNEKNGEKFYSFRLNDYKPPVKEEERQFDIDKNLDDTEIPF